MEPVRAGQTSDVAFSSAANIGFLSFLRKHTCWSLSFKGVLLPQSGARERVLETGARGQAELRDPGGGSA